jgi:signal transduction histidine kinase
VEEQGRRVDGAGRAQAAIQIGVLGVAVALAVAAAQSESQHRAAAERTLRDYAGVAGTEFVRRTAFDVGFNGYQAIGDALRASEHRGVLALPPELDPEAAALVGRLVLIDHGKVAWSSTPGESSDFEDWAGEQASHLPKDRSPFGVMTRHRTEGNREQVMVLVPLTADGARMAAFEVKLQALRPFLQRSLDRGPLLPEAVGDGRLTNAVLALSFKDAAGVERLHAGAPSFSEWEVEVPFAGFFDSVLRGSRVSVSLDPSVAGRLIEGGLPRSRAPILLALSGAAIVLTVLAFRQNRRERAFGRVRDDFVVSVSHELRTPLAQIRLYTETVLLGRCRSDEEEKRFLSAVSRECVRLGRLVDNILDFSRAERGLLDVALTPARLAPLVAAVTHSFAPLAALRGVTVSEDLDAEASAAVDEARLQQLLLNLLDNALKYGPERGDVSVRLWREGAQVRLAVEDRGPGVPPADRETIFRPFQRLGRDRQTATTGAGLGLAIVHELAALHGGTCVVEDREGGGARFAITLPQAPVPA